MTYIFRHILTELEKGRDLALATIVKTKGSSPQVPGASAIFSSQGLVDGTVGGGLLEAGTQREALKAIEEKKSLLLCIPMTGKEVTSEEEAICGGEATVLIDADVKKHRDTFESLDESLKSRNPGVLATSVQPLSGKPVSISRHWIQKDHIFGPEKETFDPFYHEQLKNAFSTGIPQLLKSGDEQSDRTEAAHLLFLEPLFPPSHLVIAGAGHVGQALAHFGSLLNFEITVIDDRAEFANADNFPEADKIIIDDIGKILGNIPLSADSFVVIVTRGHRHDADALKGCIASEAAYIGMIGSKNKIEIMHRKFLDEGWATAAQWDRVHTPIGIPIQSKTVQEIAVSIAAQLVLVRNQVQDQLRREG